ncbi:NAD(P)/FAD-dependent oxidoreductase [Tamlana crocina]|uniref:FAD-binding oxidoreductase n=1 Tax=Tamlana crocina TaxID=393006 RepID=A0ABX1DD18_9FLAO|nr:FAD-dependent oxidoreductase [Tamlana crocina]NJX15972.1 FAD-binding oxidoreductase [Tamlana crocina]
MQVDYIIVGVGLAGISFCEQLKANNNTFLVFDDASQQSSTVAGGMYNPVVLKRFTPVWKSAEQLDLALPLYAKIEKDISAQLDYKIPVYRKFASVEEQNNWVAASDRPFLSEYMSEKIIKNDNPSIEAPFGFGKVNPTGRIDAKALVEGYKSNLRADQCLREETFNHNDLNFGGNTVKYKDVEAKHVVFSEGFGVVNNPYFKALPLVPTKGELLTIHGPELNVDYIIKAGVFLIPLEDGYYRVGATHQWENLNHDATKEARGKLISRLEKVIKCEFEIIDQVAGIRPTVIDRRPLVGRHPKHENLYILNGLGTRGVMIGPYVAQQLFNFIENNEPLEKEIDIKRFLDKVE